MLSLYDYNGSIAGNLLENTDVINALNSSDNTKPLSAAQGKILNDKLGNFEFLAGGFSQTLYSNANELSSVQTIPDVTLNRDTDICFLSMESVSGTPYTQVSSLSFSFSGNTLKITARGSGFVSGHIVRVTYVIFRKGE